MSFPFGVNRQQLRLLENRNFLPRIRCNSSTNQRKRLSQSTISVAHCWVPLLQLLKSYQQNRMEPARSNATPLSEDCGATIKQILITLSLCQLRGIASEGRYILKSSSYFPRDNSSLCFFLLEKSKFFVNTTVEVSLISILTHL